MAKKSSKALDREIERLYGVHSQGLSINIMAIGKVFREARAAHEAGAPLEIAVKEAISRHCVRL